MPNCYVCVKSFTLMDAIDFSSYLHMMENDARGELSNTIPSNFLEGISVKWVEFAGIKYYANSSSTAFFVGSVIYFPFLVL